MNDIWSSGILTFDSPLKDLLDTKNYSLEDLLDEDELLQEVKGCHPQLKDFFCEEKNVAGLIQCIIRSPMNVSIMDESQRISSPCCTDNDKDKDEDNNIQQPLQCESKQEEETKSNQSTKDNHLSINENGHDHNNNNNNISNNYNTVNDKNINNTDNDQQLVVTNTSLNKVVSEQDNNNNNSSDNNSDDNQSKPKLPPGEWLLDQITEKINTEPTSKEKHHILNNATSATTMTQEDYDRIFIRYPYMACEVICCESDDILDIIVYGNVNIDGEGNDNHNNIHNHDGDGDDNETMKQSILDLLFSVLYNTPPSQLDDRRAGYLEKILTLLFRTRPKAMESYLNGDHLIFAKNTDNNDNGDNETKDQNDKEIVNIDDSLQNITLNDVTDTTIDFEGKEASYDDDNQRNGMHSIHRGGGIQLLDALFAHLHSNSISQIVQRLLIPKPSSSKGNDDNAGDYINNEENNKLDTPVASNNIDEDDDDDDDDNLITSGIEEYGNIDCDWTDGEYAINLLLARLLGLSDNMDDIFNDRIDNKASQSTNVHDSPTSVDQVATSISSDEEMTRFDCSQHASEILIAIIQHSTLSSNIMKILTRKDVLSNLIHSACSCLPHDNEKTDDFLKSFSRHESTMTSAMSVLETLVLQLGGYGNVPTSPTCEEQYSGAIPGNLPEAKNKPNRSFPTEATASTLVEQLPSLLAQLSKLLRHPDTQHWTSTMQYSRHPQQLLGISRLKIVRLIESLVLLGKREVDHLLCQSDCLEICLDLFWEFPWCSMLHQCVANLLVHVLEGGEERNEMQHYFLNHCNLMERLMESFIGVQTNNDNTTTKESSVMNRENVSLNNIEPKCIVDPSSSTEDGNEIPFITDDADCIPVSDDDIEAAMEQEDLENLNHRIVDNQNDDVSVQYDQMKIDEKAVSNNNSTGLEKFRIGYMGHVIIICQALVHACGVEDGQINDETLNNHENNTEKVNCMLSNEQQEDDNTMKNNNIMDIVLSHGQYSRWMDFISNTLASETSVQSTPLGGGYNTHNESARVDEIPCSNGDLVNNEPFESKGTFTADYNDGDIADKKFDDTEIDNFVSMMENISMSEEKGVSSTNGSHHRRKGVLGGGNNSGATFGTVVQIHQNSGDYYQFDDPLGRWQGKFPDDDGLDSNDFGDGENEDNDIDSEVPVMDLFAGNMNFDLGNQNNDTAWANFDNFQFDEAFTECTNHDDTQIINSSDPFEPIDNPTLADDVIDFGPDSQFDAAFVNQDIKSTIETLDSNKDPIEP